jgi:hypothetical protein
MPLMVTDRDGRKYAFDDSQRGFVKRILEENISLQARVTVLEVEKLVLELKLRKARKQSDELVTVSISALDPDR